MDADDSLFRKQALQAARERLWGELLLTSPRIARYAIPILLCTFALLAALLVSGSYARSESVPGYISPTGGWVRVYPPHEGRVIDVMVDEGDQVRAESPLARLVNLRAIGEEIYSEAEVESELIGQVSLLEGELESERLRQAEETGWYRDELQALLNRRGILRNRLEVLIEQLELREGALARASRLETSSMLAKADLETYLEAYLGARASKLGAEHELARLESTLRKHRVDADNLPAMHLERRSNLTRQLSAIRQQITNLRGRMDYFVTAPVSGTVRGVSVARGDQVAKGRPLFSILVEEEKLRAVLLVPSRAIGFVRKGQSVLLRYDAFPFEQFGAYEGRVTEVGRSSLTSDEMARPAAFGGSLYRVYVKPLQSQVRGHGVNASLLPGMSLEAEIQLESRSLWQWLTGPLRAVSRS